MNRHTVSGRWKLGLALILITAFQFGIIPIILKILLRKLDPFTLSWYRYAIAVGFLGLLSFRQYDLLAPYRLRGRRLFLLTVATLGLCTNFVLYTLGLDYSTPSTAQILIQLAPMLLLVGGLLIFKESFSIRQGLGLGILVIGLILFFDGKYDEILTGASTLWLGILLTAISAALWACYGLAQKQLLRHLSGRAIMFTIYCAGTLIYLIWAQPLQALTLTIVEWILLAASSIMTVIGYVSLAAAMNHLEASRVSVVLATPPLFTVGGVAVLAPIFPAHVQAEAISSLTALGIVFVVAGSILASIKKSQPPTS